MRVAITATGSRGDTLPMLALATALRRAGHTVRVVIERSCIPEALKAGLEYHEVRGMSEQFYAGPAGIAFRESFDKPITEGRRFWKSYLLPLTQTHVQADLEPYIGVDAAIFHSWLGLGPSIAEKFGISCFLASPLPIFQVPTADFPFPISRRLDNDMTPVQNYRSWRRQLGILHVGHCAQQEWRVKRLALKPVSFREALAQMGRHPHLLAYSPTVLPKPKEWGEHVHVTGYWLNDVSTPYVPPLDLQEFLAKGDLPVVIGFGSHVGRNPAQLTQTVLNALRLSKRRGILIGGFGGLKITSADLPPSVFAAPTIPYNWLLERVAAVVHHGGSGTTAVCLRAGVPQVVTPFGFDQPFWGCQMARLGVSVRPLPAKTLKADELASAICEVTSSKEILNKAQELSRAIRQETGTHNAVSAIEEYMNRAR
jgi:sterol 3beta-glucosyltransferase